MKSDSFAKLAKVAKALEFMPYHLIIIGYTGIEELSPIARAETQDPMGLALERAVMVANRLAERLGVSPDNLAVAGYGPDGGVPREGRVDFILADKRRFRANGFTRKTKNQAYQPIW